MSHMCCQCIAQAREEIEKWKAENESNVWLARHREAKLSNLENELASCDKYAKEQYQAYDEHIKKLERVRKALEDVLNHGLVYENGEVHQANTEEAKEALAALRETEGKA